MTENPLIIGHNCGYIGYAKSIFPQDSLEVAKKKSIYSPEATSKAYQDCDYLEIDLVLRKKEWWYFHPGIEGAYDKEKKKDRSKGIHFNKFLKHFKDASEEHKSKPEKPGLFLDLKKHLDQGEDQQVLIS